MTDNEYATAAISKQCHTLDFCSMTKLDGHLYDAYTLQTRLMSPGWMTKAYDNNKNKMLKIDCKCKMPVN